jgi:hypothetical protein
MLYSELRLRDVRMAVVLVDNGQLYDDGLIAKLQTQLAMPVMLVTRNESNLTGASAKAQFDAEPYLYAFLALDEIDWLELPEQEESELPF